MKTLLLAFVVVAAVALSQGHPLSEDAAAAAAEPVASSEVETAGARQKRLVSWNFNLGGSRGGRLYSSPGYSVSRYYSSGPAVYSGYGSYGVGLGGGYGAGYGYSSGYSSPGYYYNSYGAPASYETFGTHAGYHHHHHSSSYGGYSNYGGYGYGR